MAGITKIIKLYLTSISNIENGKVIDDSKVQRRQYNEHSKLDFEDIKTGKLREDTLMNVSIYDDLIIEDEEKLKILSMFTKPI